MEEFVGVVRSQSCIRLLPVGLLGLVVALANADPKAYLPSDPRASREVRTVLNFRNSYRGKCFVSGQVDLSDANWVQENTGKYPAILGFDFMRTPSRMGRQISDTANAINWSKNRHGLVTYQWHWSSPTGATDPGRGFYTDKTRFDLDEVLKHPRSAEYRELIKDIDDVAGEIKKLSRAHVAILYRPLHEAQGGWFWWGAKGASNCKKLYLLEHDRIVKHHGLHNLIWVWTAYPASQGKGDPAEWYPGDNVVDIVASDYCQTKQDFEDLSNMKYGRKLDALAETMNATDPNTLLTVTPWAYWVAWARRDWDKNSNEDMKKAMASTLTVSLDMLPSILGQNK